MKVVELVRGQSEYRKRLQEVNRSFKLHNLLEFIRFCLELKFYNCDELLDLWSSNKKTLKTTDCLLPMLDIFSSVGYSFVEPHLVPEIKINEENPELSRLVGNLVTAQEEQTHLVEENRATYSWFFPSICISELLENIYPDEINPGMVIGRYLEALFPAQLSEEYKGFVTSAPSTPNYKIPYDSALSKLISDVSCWAINNSLHEVQIRTCLLDCIHDLLPIVGLEEWKRTTSISEAIVFLQYAPRSFFITWFHEWLLNENNHSNSPHKPTLDDLLTTLLCLPFGKGNEPLVFEESLEIFLPNKSLLTHLNKKKKADLTWFSFSDFVWVFQIFGMFMDNEKINYCLISKFAENVTKYRVTYLSGIFPFEPIDKQCTWPIATRLLAEDNDLLLLLAYTSLNMEDQLDYNDHSLGLLPEKNDCSFQDIIELFNSKQQDYLVLISKAYADGLYELGTAFLSLYLFYRTVFLHGRHNLSSKLIETICLALTLPGAKVLKHTLKFTVESFDKNFASDPVAKASALILSQFLPQGAELKLLDGGWKGEKALSETVSTFLVGELGAERWGKLSPNSRDCLVSAEQQWRNNAVDFGFGIKDWSGLITTYCKAIEGELVDRLNDFFVSVEYNVYLADKGLKRPAKPTAGWLLKELKSYDNMPQKLQVLLNNSRVRLAGENDLVNRLYDIVQNYRNISAHHDAVSMKRFADFKEKLFQSGLLSRFIDTFA